MNKRLRILLAAAGAAAVATGFSYASSTKTTARSATAGIVVIDTNLGYQGGQAAGTGMVLTSNGEVLTNNHVIQGATAIKVVVPSTGRSYTADVLGYSVTGDTALLKLEGASGLTTIAKGDSSKLKRGQLVRAIGNAGGTGQLAIAAGRITGLGKTIVAGDGQGSEQLTGLIETDAPIQPGDSGGPLIDSSGRVQGMNTAASVAGGFYFRNATNDAYAIPINAALKVVKQVESGTSTATVHVGGTAFLGIQLASPGDGYGYGGNGSGGALVAGVLTGSPADGAGLAYGDQITAIDGHAVGSADALRTLLLQKHPGDKAALTWVDQAGTQHTATVTLSSGPAQ